LVGEIHFRGVSETMSETATLPARSDVPVEKTWDLESVFPTPEAWEAAYKEVDALIPELVAFQGRLSEGPKLLVECFQTFERVFRLRDKVFVYAGLSAAVDSQDQAAAARSGQARGLMAQTNAAAAYLDPELMSIGFETLYRWADEEPTLATYRYYFEKLERRQPHVRSGEVEQVLAMATDPMSTASATAGLLTNADLRFEPARGEDGTEMEVGQSSISALVTHADREIRHTAWESYADGYLAFKNTLTNCLTAAVKGDVFNMRARDYGSSLEASLSPNNVPVEVFHNLIDVFKANLPTWHRYWDVRRKALGYEKLHVYDIKAPLTPSKPEVPFEGAVDWIAEGMTPLGDEYVEALRRGCLQDRWVDHVINKGKRQGAFSGGSYDTLPFIMMSYADDLFSLSTLAHELGHSLHKVYSVKEQPYLYYRYSLFVAEVASNFNQAMVRNYLLDTQTDPDFQIALIEEAMSNFHRYFFIMPTLARFELEMHERAERGAPINAESLIALMADLFAEGYGDGVVFDHDRIGITWAQFNHLYMNFYVYQYATGISGAHALAEGVLAREDGAAEKYLQFLSAGGAMYPLDALQLAGVDLRTPAPVETTFSVLARYVDRLEELVS
jgi:oligoendopeptidase F